MALTLNQPAPDFELPSTSGANFRLSKEGKGKPLILYFYPKDFTPGCTKEACSFRDQFDIFRDLDITVVGVSTDPMKVHKRFKKTHGLPFELLSDTKKVVCKKYDALLPFIGVPRRITYLLDAKHKIAAVYQDLFGAEKHIKKMITEIKRLSS